MPTATSGRTCPACDAFISSLMPLDGPVTARAARVVGTRTGHAARLEVGNVLVDPSWQPPLLDTTGALGAPG
jgi:hypothetical protein